MRARRLGAGFSLIELLVVTGIIMLLAGMLAPSLSSARQRARAISCMSNLKQLGIATQMYWDDCNGKLVALNGDFPVWGDAGSSNAWSYALFPLHKNTTLYRDPGRPQWMIQLSVDYYLNILPSFLSTTNQPPGIYPVDSRAISTPSAFILMSEDLYSDAPQEIDPTNETQDKTGFSGLGGAYLPYHLGQVNILFADGHCDDFGRWDGDELTYWYHAMENWQETTP
ncbi:DUF1559 domain-containing protein [bacterium]|nr:DUF1559 domain-containing protein [bacterium]